MASRIRTALIGAMSGAAAGLIRSQFIEQSPGGVYVPHTLPGTVAGAIAFCIPWALIGAAIGFFLGDKTPTRRGDVALNRKVPKAKVAKANRRDGRSRDVEK